MKLYNLKCKVCKKDFECLGSLHKHVKKHGYIVANYYTEFFPRKNKLTGELMPFKDIESYFSKDFSTRIQMNKWLESIDSDCAKEYIQSLILKRTYDKERKFLPFHLELTSCFLPEIDTIKKHFKSYSNFSKECGIPLLFDKPLNPSFFEEHLPEDLEVMIDTREQKPLSFKCSSFKQKLDFGYYCLLGKYYDYTYVDRKSGQDFTLTMMGENYERFKREIQKAKDFDSYIFVVVESDVSKIIAYNKKFKRKVSIDFLLKRARDLMYEFPNNCQFVFTGSRANSSVLIPRILFNGKKIWKVDMQYFIDYELGRRKSKKK